MTILCEVGRVSLVYSYGRYEVFVGGEVVSSTPCESFALECFAAETEKEV